jgi:hypothetical protein
MFTATVRLQVLLPDPDPLPLEGVEAAAGEELAEVAEVMSDSQSASIEDEDPAAVEGEEAPLAGAGVEVGVEARVEVGVAEVEEPMSSEHGSSGDEGEPLEGEPLDGEPPEGEPLEGEPPDGEPLEGPAGVEAGGVGTEAGVEVGVETTGAGGEGGGLEVEPEPSEQPQVSRRTRALGSAAMTLWSRSQSM